MRALDALFRAQSVCNKSEGPFCLPFLPTTQKITIIIFITFFSFFK